MSGDPACWLDEVCPDCGAIPEGEHDCPRAPSDEASEESAAPTDEHPDGGVQSRS